MHQPLLAPLPRVHRRLGRPRRPALLATALLLLCSCLEPPTPAAAEPTSAFALRQARKKRIRHVRKVRNRRVAPPARRAPPPPAASGEDDFGDGPAARTPATAPLLPRDSAPPSVAELDEQPPLPAAAAPRRVRKTVKARDLQDGGDTPVWKRWWFWTAIGGVAVTATAIGLGVGLSKREASIPTDIQIYDAFLLRFP